MWKMDQMGGRAINKEGFAIFHTQKHDEGLDQGNCRVMNALVNSGETLDMTLQELVTTE